VVLRKVEVLGHIIDSEIHRSHFQTILLVPPTRMGIFYHLSCQQGIWRSSLVAGSIIEKEEASCRSICLCFENVDCVIDLLKQVIRVEVPISVLPCFEKYASFTVSKGESRRLSE
jgi:hypothetical protein